MTPRWRVEMRCDGGLCPYRIVETESRAEAGERALAWADAQGFTGASVRAVVRVWPTWPEDDPGPEDRKDFGGYCGRGNETPH